jgi:hypothetical protein
MLAEWCIIGSWCSNGDGRGDIWLPATAGWLEGRMFKDGEDGTRGAGGGGIGFVDVRRAWWGDGGTELRSGISRRESLRSLFLGLSQAASRFQRSRSSVGCRHEKR